MSIQGIYFVMITIFQHSWKELSFQLFKASVMSLSPQKNGHEITFIYSAVLNVKTTHKLWGFENLVTPMSFFFFHPNLFTTKKKFSNSIYEKKRKILKGFFSFFFPLLSSGCSQKWSDIRIWFHEQRHSAMWKFYLSTYIRSFCKKSDSTWICSCKRATGIMLGV
jgi:hypothetical protein